MFSIKIRILLFCIPFLMLACQTDPEERQKKSVRFKNVVVIVGDDHASNVIGAYGNPLIRTPNIDRLAEMGALFSHAYANSPLCSASRQSLLTGKYPHATGVNLLFTPFNDSKNTTIAEHLRDSGFNTALIGKSHFNSWLWNDLYDDHPPDYGFNRLIDMPEYRQWLENNPPQPIPENVLPFSKNPEKLPPRIARMNPFTRPQPYYTKDAPATFLVNSAIQFIEENRNDRMFLWIAFHEPHAPFEFPLEYQGKYSPDSVPLPSGSDEDDQWIPERFKGFSDQQKRGVIASYYTSVEYMDYNIGRLLKAIKTEGLLDETLIIYLGDQGYLLNHHKRFEKHTMWEEAVKSPLIVVANGVITPGTTIDNMIEFIDIAPFIAEMTGTGELQEAQGKSFFPQITGERDSRERIIFSEFLEDNKAMVASRDWKYIFSTGKRDLGQGYATGNGPPGITHRLYNLTDDPRETTNVAALPENKTLVDSMQSLMLKRFMETHPHAGDVPDYLNKVGKLVWFCEPRDVGAEYGGEPLRIFSRNN